MAKYSAASAAGGALSGAASGAAIGSAVPGIGTAVGAVAGGLIGGVSALFGSKKKKKKKLSTLDPEQKKLRAAEIDALYGKGDFANLFSFDPEAANANFDANVARPAYRNFQEKAVPTITGQFRNSGIGNSSYTGQALSNAGRDVQESLDAKRMDYLYSGQQQANSNKINALNNLIGMQTFNYSAPGTSSLDNILSQVTPAATDYLFNKYGSNNTANQPIESTRLSRP